jgi:hypothetical protein
VPRSCRVDRAALAALLLTLGACGNTAHAPDSDSDSDSGASSPYRDVTAIIARSCAYERCHSGALIGAGLDLRKGSDYRAALLDRPSCEYPPMATVEPGDPEHSWLMVKLTAPFRDRDDPYAFYIRFTPDADWDPELRGCRDRTTDGSPLFGQRMPATAPNMLPAADLDRIREWIAAGAPP